MPFKSHFKQTASLMAAIIILGGCASSVTLTPTTIKTATIAQNQLSAPRFGHTVVKVNDQVYTIGGSNKHGLLTTIEVIDSKTLASTVKHVNLTPRLYGAAVWDGKESIYVFGGATRKGRYTRQISQVEIIDLNTFNVSSGPDMPIPCNSHSVSRIDSDIYIIGGRCNEDSRARTSYSSHVQKYSIKNQSWSTASSLPQKMETQTIVIDNTLYAIGGYTGTRAVENVIRYDLKTDSWLDLPPLPIKTSAHSLAAIDDKILVLGDYEQMGRSLMFNTKNKEWLVLDIPFKPVRHASAVSSDDQVILVGGITGSSGPSQDYIQSIQIK